ncbi:MAG: hypothetical protein M1546_15855 [Chloroflexi bacterium]|nr:hypothetical protein [Chloroflexota bacterium]
MTKIYFTGPAGAGKTSRLVARLVALISANIRPDRILVLVPQQAQAAAFRAALAQIKGRFRARGEPDITTIYGLAQQHVSLFFPLIAERAGFTHPQHEPVMINVEAAQYFLDQIVAPRAADFDDLKLFRPRLLGQILDSMNKAAECGFGLDEIAERLGAAWSGDSQRLVSFRRVQEVALDFRRYCLDHSLLDFSLQMETFAQHLLDTSSYRDYITARYRHVLADNVEENPPVMHDFLAEVLKTCDSAWLAEDDPGGYRLFLGADVESARTLRALCDEVVSLDHSYTAAPEAVAFGRALRQRFGPPARPSSVPSLPLPPEEGVALREALGDAPGTTKYWTGMVDWVVNHIVDLAGRGVHPREIAVLAPYVEDVLRFELQERLHPHDIRVRLVRPSRPLHDHPIVRMLVICASLAHPEWGQPVLVSDLTRALSVAVDQLDVARAQLIADAALKASTRQLVPLEDPALWQRVGMRFFERYSLLQQWLTGTADQLDLFWQRLFTDVLSQPGFGLHQDREGALVCDKLFRSARTFREVFERAQLTAQELPAARPATAPFDIGLEYINTLGEDIIAAQYAPEREPDIADDDAVLVTPAYTYLINNFRSRYQFWLDINSLGWYERVYQPLTHPYVLSRRWARGRVWTEEDEHRSRQLMLNKVIGGLTYRCAGKLYLVSSQLSISGQEEAGPLARAIQKVLRQAK